MLVELLHFETNIINGGFNLGSPIVERTGGALEDGDALVMCILEICELVVPHRVAVGEALIPLEILILEALAQLVGERLTTSSRSSLLSGFMAP